MSMSMTDSLFAFLYVVIHLLFGFCLFINRHLRDEAKPVPCSYVEPLELYNHVLRCSAEAFEYVTPGKQSILSCSFFFV